MIGSKTEGHCSIARHKEEGVALTVSQRKHPTTGWGEEVWGEEAQVRLARCDMFIAWRGPVFQGKWALPWISSPAWVVGRKEEEAQGIGKGSSLCWRPFPPHPLSHSYCCAFVYPTPSTKTVLTQITTIGHSKFHSKYQTSILSSMLIIFMCMGRNSFLWSLI